MNIAAKGHPNQLSELKELLSSHSVSEFKINEIDSYDVIFDLDFDENPDQFTNYLELDNTLVIAGCVKLQLEEILAEAGVQPNCTLIGMNALPTFINRSLIECCALSNEDKETASTTLSELGLEPRFVESRVGLVTPRIVCMIINEAYFTVQEGTASREDIDLGMKLGTAYPKGPFEWCAEIGIDNVYETLDALYQDTRDERYKICPLLKKEYLKSFVA
jgi:3-hydroxybutyryl-CoA dehydrogenase